MIITTLLFIFSAILLFGVFFTFTSSQEEAKVFAQAQEQATNQALSQLNAERETLANLVNELRKSDPSILDAQFLHDSQGEKTIQLAREEADGTISTWQAPASVFAQLQPPSTEKDPAPTQESSTSDWMVPALLGYLAASAFSPGSGAMSSGITPSAYQERRKQSFSAYSGATLAAASSAPRNSLSGSSRNVGVNRSFSGTGARSGGYSSGG